MLAVRHGDRERCLAAGMDDYLAKPLRMPEVAATIRQWLQEGRFRLEGTSPRP